MGCVQWFAFLLKNGVQNFRSNLREISDDCDRICQMPHSCFLSCLLTIKFSRFNFTRQTKAFWQSDRAYSAQYHPAARAALWARCVCWVAWTRVAYTRSASASLARAATTHCAACPLTCRLDLAGWSSSLLKVFFSDKLIFSNTHKPFVHSSSRSLATVSPSRLSYCVWPFDRSQVDSRAPSQV